MPVARIKPAPPSTVTLIQWNIAVNKTNGEMHFVGFDINTQRGRLSTPISSFDESTGMGITTSGSVYQVLDKPSVPHTSALLLFEINLKGGRVLVGSDFDWKYPFTDETLH